MAKVSVVVPTYDEVGNLRELTRRLFEASNAAKLDIELLFAEDESETTAQSVAIVEELAKEGFGVRMHVRQAADGRGLSHRTAFWQWPVNLHRRAARSTGSAVLLGFDLAKYDTLVCMDADLQHEPESMPAVARPVRFARLAESADYRAVISKGATILAAPLTTSSDPMSGFFCVHRATLNKGRRACNPLGFKIALEIMVRCRCRRIVDVPIMFRDRVSGKSKLTMRQNVEYLRQLLALYWYLYGGYIVATVVASITVLIFAIYNSAR